MGTSVYPPFTVHFPPGSDPVFLSHKEFLKFPSYTQCGLFTILFQHFYSVSHVSLRFFSNCRYRHPSSLSYNIVNRVQNWYLQFQYDLKRQLTTSAGKVGYLNRHPRYFWDYESGVGSCYFNLIDFHPGSVDIKSFEGSIQVSSYSKSSDRISINFKKKEERTNV